MQNRLISNLLLLLSLFHLTVYANPHKFPAILGIRQTTSNPTDLQCLDYSRTANISTIGSNATYRSAFLQASPRGTFKDFDMFTAAITALPALTKNATLNKACGNLTTVALTEAAQNYTKGVVAEFSGLVPDGTPQRSGFSLAIIVSAVVFSFCGVFLLAP